ncbi:MAG: hypothetical protein AAF645_24255, partial [Myxococcota bacterium]
MLTLGCAGLLPLPPGGWRADALIWSGLRWSVRHGGPRAGPGAMLWDGGPAGVWVEADGRLRLTAGRRGGRWTGAEVAAELPAGSLGAAVCLDDPRRIDDAFVAGVFLYRDDRHELDVEVSRWGRPDRR